VQQRSYSVTWQATRFTVKSPELNMKIVNWVCSLISRAIACAGKGYTPIIRNKAQKCNRLLNQQITKFIADILKLRKKN
jgi:hypothetical protein